MGQIRSAIEKEATALEKPTLDESGDILPSMLDSVVSPWLPRCAVPDRLFQFYQDSNVMFGIEDTQTDALSDLQDLAPILGMKEEAFRQHIRDSLRQIPSIQRFLEKIPSGMSDAQGREIVNELRENLSQSEVKKQWSIVRDWIGYFFGDQFEVAAQSYVVRLKSR